MSAADNMVPWRDPATRSRGIGSSDAAAVVGLDRYVTPLALFLEKRGELPPSASGEEAEWGTILEPVLLRQLARREGLHVVGRNDEGEPTLWDAAGRARPAPHMEPDLLGTLVHPDYPWMRAHLDAVVLNSGFAEAKTAGFFVRDWGEGDDEIPERHVVQIHHSAAILRALGIPNLCRVPLLKAGQRWHVYTIDPNPDLMDALIEREAEFWQRVKEGVPPDPTAADLGVLKQLYPRHVERELIAAPGDLLDTLAHELADAIAQRKAAADAEDETKARIQVVMQDAGKIVGDGFNITWRNIKDQEEIDWRGIVATLCESLNVPDEEQARTVVQHTTTKPGYRRFTPNLKKIGG